MLCLLISNSAHQLIIKFFIWLIERSHGEKTHLRLRNPDYSICIGFCPSYDNLFQTYINFPNCVKWDFHLFFPSWRCEIVVADAALNQNYHILTTENSQESSKPTWCLKLGIIAVSLKDGVNVYSFNYNYTFMKYSWITCSLKFLWVWIDGMSSGSNIRTFTHLLKPVL